MAAKSDKSSAKSKFVCMEITVGIEDDTGKRKGDDAESGVDFKLACATQAIYDMMEGLDFDVIHDIITTHFVPEGWTMTGILEPAQEFDDPEDADMIVWEDGMGRAKSVGQRLGRFIKERTKGCLVYSLKEDIRRE